VDLEHHENVRCWRVELEISITRYAKGESGIVGIASDTNINA